MAKGIKKDKWLVQQRSLSSEENWSRKKLVQFVRNCEPNANRRTQLIGLINKGMVRNLDALKILMESTEEQLGYAEVSS